MYNFGTDPHMCSHLPKRRCKTFRSGCMGMSMNNFISPSNGKHDLSPEGLSGAGGAWGSEVGIQGRLWGLVTSCGQYQKASSNHVGCALYNRSHSLPCFTVVCSLTRTITLEGFWWWERVWEGVMDDIKGCTGLETASLVSYSTENNDTGIGDRFGRIQKSLCEDVKVS